MNATKLTLAVMAAGLLASCADDISNGPSNGSDPNAVGSQGYIGVSIGMPSDPATRGLNDQFDDGLASEYGVSSAAVLFFTGTEANPTFYKAYSVGVGEWNPVNDNPAQITQNRIVTFPVDFAKETEDDLWALAVINYGSVMTVNGDYTLTVGENEFTGTFNDFMALTTTATLTGENRFFMTNAPYSSVAGTTVSATPAPTNPKFHVLSLVNKDRIYPTEQAALEQPAAAIFVERAVAKVEVNRVDLTIKDGAINFPATGYVIGGVQWALDNTEPSTFIVRNLDAPGKLLNPDWALYDTNSANSTLTHHYRFLGAAGFGHTNWPNTPDSEEHYRTYFCMDPNGAGIAEGSSLVSNTVFQNTRTSAGALIPQYCYENTFDVEHMDYRNTTRAVIKITYNTGGTGSAGNLYTVGDDKKNVYYFETAASYLAWDVLNNSDVIAAWKKHFEDLNKPYSNNATTENMDPNRGNRTIENEWMKLTFALSESEGRMTLSKIELFDGEGGTVTFADETKAIKEINKNKTVKYYKDGVAYYAVRIRHFGNDLAPWTSGETTTNTTTDAYGKTNGAIGPQDIRNYLGRYGVVRNNWYLVNLDQITQMGEPVVGDLPLDGTPDDRVVKEESISCRINIMSWAKRNQTSNL